MNTPFHGCIVRGWSLYSIVSIGASTSPYRLEALPNILPLLKRYTNTHSQLYCKNDGDANEYDDCCLAITARHRAVIAVLVRDGLIGVTAGAVLVRFDIVRHVRLGQRGASSGSLVWLGKY